MKIRMLLAGCCVVASVAISVTAHGVCAQDDTDRARMWWTDAGWERQLTLEAMLREGPEHDSLRRFHDLVCAEPHPAGSDAHERLMANLEAVYAEYGIATERHTFHAYLGEPSKALVEVYPSGPHSREAPIRLSLKENGIDEWASRDDAPIGYNAFSGSGDVTAPVVYANYGTKADFEKLAELGIDCTGKIVIARYGRNYRGYKAKFAEEAGAAGLLMYTDPADSGFVRGPMYPEGGFANGSAIQRGSIKTLPYAGDPLTPAREATEDARRLDPADVALPKIPVQPMGWTAASEILSRMVGAPLPEEIAERWRGGLELPYNLTSGDELQVRMQVTQERAIRPSGNVIATIPGTDHPDDLIIIGCHSDAWTFGAGDPHAGTIIMLEAARVLAQAAEQGLRPRRTIIFAHWGAEEFGIVGSTEWVEANMRRLRTGGVAYINLDMAAMGLNFRSSAAPLLKSVIADVARAVPHPNEEFETVYDQWVGDRDAPGFGNLGGGSDHLPFNCHAAVPCCTLGAGGARGVSYHSNYDNLAWYRKVVGDDYVSAHMLTQMTLLLAARLANADVLPLDPERYAPDVRRHLNALQLLKDAKEMSASFRGLHELADRIAIVAARCNDGIARLTGADAAAPSQAMKFNSTLRMLDRAWMSINGLPDRSWYRSLYAATDPDSGYAAWMFPGIRRALEDGDEAALEIAITNLERSLSRILRQLELVQQPSPNR